MASLAISKRTIDKYVGFLIGKLAESMETNKTEVVDLKTLFGAWEDKREAEEIIKFIRDSRVEKTNSDTF